MAIDSQKQLIRNRSLKSALKSFKGSWEEKTTLPMGIGGLLYLAAYAGQVITANDSNWNSVWTLTANAIWAVFLIDIIIRLIGSDSLQNFIRSCWFDLVCLLFPTIRFFRAFRAVLAARMVSKYFTNRTHRAGIFLATFVPLIWFGAAIAVMDAEATEPGSSLKELPNALWWSISTITTIGYGQFPESIEGRVISVILMLTGIGLFSAAAGLLASWILKDPNSSMK